MKLTVVPGTVNVCEWSGILTAFKTEVAPPSLATTDISVVPNDAVKDCELVEVIPEAAISEPVEAPRATAPDP